MGGRHALHYTATLYPYRERREPQMPKNLFIVTVSLIILSMGALTSCGKQETAAPQASQTETITGNWKTALPAGFEGLAVKDGGACYLDAVNAAIKDDP